MLATLASPLLSDICPWRKPATLTTKNPPSPRATPGSSRQLWTSADGQTPDQKPVIPRRGRVCGEC
eukprot:1037469-Lingulodinium_polyedra.AAC.1